MSLPAFPATFEAEVQTVSDRINALETDNALLDADDELLHDRIADAQRKLRENSRKRTKNEKEIVKLRRKREIASAAARAIMEVDQP